MTTRTNAGTPSKVSREAVVSLSLCSFVHKNTVKPIHSCVSLASRTIMHKVLLLVWLYCRFSQDCLHTDCLKHAHKCMHRHAHVNTQHTQATRTCLPRKRSRRSSNTRTASSVGARCLGSCESDRAGMMIECSFVCTGACICFVTSYRERY